MQLSVLEARSPGPNARCSVCLVGGLLRGPHRAGVGEGVGVLSDSSYQGLNPSTRAPLRTSAKPNPLPTAAAPSPRVRVRASSRGFGWEEGSTHFGPWKGNT